MAPEGWRRVTIADLGGEGPSSIKIGPFGSSLKKVDLLDRGPYRVYGQENVHARDFGLGGRFVDEAKFESLRSCSIKPGDVVITMMGSLGGAAVVPDGIAPGLMDSHLLRIRPDSAQVDAEFLATFLAGSPPMQKQLAAKAHGGIMAGLNAAIVRSFELDLPPLAEQRKIAAILSSVDETIENTEAVIAQLDVVKKSMLEELLTRGIPGRHSRFKQTEIGEVPASWELGRLGDATVPGGLQTGPFGSQLKAEEYSARVIHESSSAIQTESLRRTYRAVFEAVPDDHRRLASE